jgi:Acetyltransferase (GNAT) domain
VSKLGGVAGVDGPGARADLIEDRGEAATGDAFFRSRPFLDAEGVTHTLRIETDASELLTPLIVREIPPPMGRKVHPESTYRPIDLAFDAISPYGYPGLVSADRGDPLSSIATQGTPAPLLDPAGIDFSATGLVSLFVRHTLGEPPLAATTERNLVQLADPALPPKSRPSDRRQIRRNLEAGYALTLVPGPETTPTQRAGFLDVYEQTMRRTAAAGHYFFGAAYFDRVLEADRTWLALAAAPDGELAAASLAALSDGYLHYYLSGSADSHLRDSPMKNVVARLIELAAELSLPLNLGGGISPGDALEEFKRGFANRQHPWHTSEIICDKEKYQQLSAGHKAGTFFPTYRAPQSPSR